MVDSPTRQRRVPSSTMPAIRRFDFDEYYRMTDAGILGAKDRVELIEGVILEMSAIGSRHYACVNDLARALISRLSEGAIIGVQGPLRLSAMSVPEPDLVVLRLRADHYRTALPGPEDVLLLIEVSDSSLQFRSAHETAPLCSRRYSRGLDRRSRERPGACPPAATW